MNKPENLRLLASALIKVITWCSIIDKILGEAQDIIPNDPQKLLGLTFTRNNRILKELVSFLKWITYLFFSKYTIPQAIWAAWKKI